MAYNVTKQLIYSKRSWTLLLRILQINCISFAWVYAKIAAADYLFSCIFLIRNLFSFTDMLSLHHVIYLCYYELIQVITALGKIWHVEHFCCYSCQEELGTRSFFERDEMPYCEPCYHKLFAPLCENCNEPILDVSLTAAFIVLINNLVEMIWNSVWVAYYKNELSSSWKEHV